MTTKDKENYKVFIPSAGLGTRLGNLSKNLNKALVSIDNRPVISHVIEKFPKSVEIVIALGHKGDLVRNYLEIAHQDRLLTFVEIDNYDGSGSGLGYSILCCEKELQCPFVFCPNDTMVLEEIPKPDFDWMGYSKIIDNRYRTLKVKEGKVVRTYEKRTINDGYVYIGLCGINHYKKFWESMKNGIRYGAIEMGEVYGLNKIIENYRDVKSFQFTWYDTGDVDKLKQTREKFYKEDSPEILEKDNEAIWFTNGKVIKYFGDSEISNKRVLRANMLKGYVPTILEHNSNLYSYKMIKGKTLSKVVNKKLFNDFMDFSDKFWIPHYLESEEINIFYDKCKSFYEGKTISRVNMFFNRFGIEDQEETINQIKIPALSELFSKVDWDYISKGIPCRFHGDYHFENVLVSEDGQFVLVDWRQDFSGILDYGDIYYDFAKLMHGLIVSHELVNKEMFDFSKDGDIIYFDILRKNKLVECERDLRKKINIMGYDLKKVYILTSLIFINIAPLHHDPYGKFLFYLGKYMLHGELND